MKTFAHVQFAEHLVADADKQIARRHLNGLGVYHELCAPARAETVGEKAKADGVVGEVGETDVV